MFGVVGKSAYLCTRQFPPGSPQGQHTIGGTYFVYRHTMYTKQPISLAQQIQTLKQRGLIIDNEARAEEPLWQ